MEHVYIGKGTDDRYYKIGRTGTQLRLKQHKTSNPTFEYQLTLPTECASSLERHLHQWFSAKRINGTKEWFDLNLGDLENIPLLREQFEQLHSLSAEVDALKTRGTSGPSIPPDDLTREDYKRLRQLKEQEARIKLEIELIENRLKVNIGVSEGIDGLASWRSQEVMRFDSALFRQSHPALYDRFRITNIRIIFKLL